MFFLKIVLLTVRCCGRRSLDIQVKPTGYPFPSINEQLWPHREGSSPFSKRTIGHSIVVAWWKARSCRARDRVDDSPRSCSLLSRPWCAHSPSQRQSAAEDAHQPVVRQFPVGQGDNSLPSQLIEINHNSCRSLVAGLIRVGRLEKFGK